MAGKRAKKANPKPKHIGGSRGATPQSGQTAVFISWAGPRSRRVASVLKARLPEVIQAVQPWMSAHDINPGERWGVVLDQQLETTDFGIICVTPENRAEPWLLYESGSLAKRVESSRVCPYLIGLKPSDVTGPLSRFQMTEMSRDGLMRIIREVNKSIDRPLPDASLERAFELAWPQLELDLQQAAAPLPSDGVVSPTRPTGELLEDILEILRDQERRMAEQFKPFQYTGFLPIESGSVVFNPNTGWKPDLGNVILTGMAGASRGNQPSSIEIVKSSKKERGK